MKLNSAILIIFIIFCRISSCASLDFLVDVDDEKLKTCLKNGAAGGPDLLVDLFRNSQEI